MMETIACCMSCNFWIHSCRLPCEWANFLSQNVRSFNYIWINSGLKLDAAIGVSAYHVCACVSVCWCVDVLVSMCGSAHSSNKMRLRDLYLSPNRRINRPTCFLQLVAQPPNCMDSKLTIAYQGCAGDEARRDKIQSWVQPFAGWGNTDKIWGRHELSMVVTRIAHCCWCLSDASSIELLSEENKLTGLRKDTKRMLESICANAQYLHLKWRLLLQVAQPVCFHCSLSSYDYSREFVRENL